MSFLSSETAVGQIKVNQSVIQGVVTAPASKSHTLRAVLFAGLAQGTSKLDNCLPSTDKDAMVRAWRQCGACIVEKKQSMVVDGVAANLSAPDDPIDAGNSGIVLRFMAALAATQSSPVIITGDHSICSNRPVKPLLESFPQLGVTCRSINHNDHAPIEITGPMQSGSIIIDGADSQPISGLMIAASQAPGEQVIKVLNPGELPWLDLTCWWLDRLGLQYQRDGYQQFRFTGKQIIKGFELTVPGDFSSIAYPVAAAMISGSSVTITGLDWSDLQGDKALFDIFENMGARLIRDHAKGCLIVEAVTSLNGVTVDINRCVDCITILAVVACFATSPTRITGAAIARKKECDRIAAITGELRKMGGYIEEFDDGMLIYPSKLKAAQVHSYHDHRMVMSLAVAAMQLDGETEIFHADCITKTYPHFVEDMQNLGANLEWQA